jgi:23S rRNA (uracil1939-C5)-methyltransferase
MKKEFVENATAIDISDEGKAVLKCNGRVVFVKGLVPGDVADIEITRVKKKHAEGKLIKLKEPSPDRIHHLCQHFGACGGCSWQNLDYKAQLSLKQRQVSEAFKRIAGVEVEETLPIIGSEKIYQYRNKLEFTFSSKRWLNYDEMNESNFGQPGLGFHVPKLFDKVIDIKECHLQPEPSNAIRLAVREFALREKMPFFDLREQQGFLRNLMIRTASTGELMVMVAFFREDRRMREKLLTHILKSFPQITTLVYTINSKKNDSLADLEMESFSGLGYITEKMKLRNGKELSFRISPQSFFQTNTAQANNLYAKASEFAEFNGTENVFDLYTGCGTIASFVAGEVKRVVGIENVKQAIIDARINAEINGITNAEFFAGDMQFMLSEDFCRHNGIPDVIITDPPRGGMHPDTVNDILKLAPAKVVYISCNPSTQARDVAMMREKYTVKKVQAVDMFPHTSHIENVALLIKK